MNKHKVAGYTILAMVTVSITVALSFLFGITFALIMVGVPIAIVSLLALSIYLITKEQ